MAEIKKILEEGAVINGILQRRLVRNNQNCLIVTAGPTGSGKSYSNLRIAQLWYKKRFNEDFPKYNICFGPLALIKRMKNKNLPLRKGELFILEEAGTTLGSLDFHSKTAKAFMDVMQVFRTLNFGLMFNLPAFNSMNKSLRELAHIQLITNGINRDEKKVNLKCYLLEMGPTNAKQYRKFPVIVHDGGMIKVSSISYSLPDKNLSESYEKDKLNYVMEVLDKSEQTMEGVEEKNKGPVQRLTPLWEKIQWCRELGIVKQKDIAQKLGRSQSTISEAMQRMDAKGIEPAKPLNISTGA